MTDDEVERLRRENARLAQENAELKQRIEEERVHRWQCMQDENHQALQANGYRAKIETLDKDVEVVRLHEELQKQRKKCNVYAEALEESHSFFVELKRLYAEIEPYLMAQGATPGTPSGESPC